MVLPHLEDYLKAHPNTRLVVVDTWAKVVPRSNTRRCTQYEGDYETLTLLKRLADTYHVSVLAVHHLRKTGAVDGTLILKRERGQPEASLFVAGCDIECEQQLAMSFDATTALWSVVGNAEEAGRTRARQGILHLLRAARGDEPARDRRDPGEGLPHHPCGFTQDGGNG